MQKHHLLQCRPSCELNEYLEMALMEEARLGTFISEAVAGHKKIIDTH